MTKKTAPGAHDAGRKPDAHAAHAFATRVIHGGQHPDPLTGAVMPPIYATSTYVQSSPGVHKGYEYGKAGKVPAPSSSDVHEMQIILQLLNDVFAAECGKHGLYLHPRHNWFVSAAMDERDLDQALVAVEAGVAAVASVRR